jgi:ABC-type polysaccharide/polyol phosphate transport system, ATPase component
MRYVASFTELGDDLYQPTRTYSAGMRGRLSFALSLALEFDTYIVDEGHATGDARFAKRFNQEWRQRLQTANIIMVSHRISTIHDHCTHAAILHQGRLRSLDDDRPSSPNLRVSAGYLIWTTTRHLPPRLKAQKDRDS